MDRIKKALGIGALVLTLAGCSGLGTTHTASPTPTTNPAPTTNSISTTNPKRDISSIAISGDPITVVADCADKVVAMVIDVDGNYVLASGSVDSSQKCVEALALLLSEKKDVYNEKVILTGYYTGYKRFEITTLSVNGTYLELLYTPKRD